MNHRHIVIGAIAVILLLAAVVPLLRVQRHAQEEATAYPAASTKYANSEIGLSFSYRGGPQGYVLEERESSSEAGPARSIVLTKSVDFEQMRSRPIVGGEGPAVIAVHVFSNAKKQFPLAWAMERTDYSAYNLKMGEDVEAIVGGANSLQYSADGLYPARYAIVAHGSRMYVFVGQYLSPEDPMRRDFGMLLSSVQFIPETANASGELNINAICEGALAYMTFPNGAAADTFVKDCKDGKHPEVVERWKLDNNILDGRAI